MAWFHSAPSPLSLITRHPSSFLWWLRFIATGKEDKEWHHLPMWTENGFKAMPGKRQCSLSSVFYLFKKIPSAIHSFQTGGGGGGGCTSSLPPPPHSRTIATTWRHFLVIGVESLTGVWREEARNAVEHACRAQSRLSQERMIWPQC